MMTGGLVYFSRISRISFFLAAVLLGLSLQAHATGRKSAKCEALLTKSITRGWVRKMATEGQASSPAIARLRDIIQRIGFPAAALDQTVIRQHHEKYTFELPRGPITDQKQSGRCWIFAGLNMMRSQLIAENKVPENFEFSENYLHFFNMIEKSNRYLENLAQELAPRKPGKNGERVGSIRDALEPSISDGGWYEDFLFLVNKYGVVPKSAMPETRGSVMTEPLNAELKTHLAKSGAEMMLITEKAKEVYKSEKRRLSEHDHRQLMDEAKERAMTGVWKILATHLGEPPRRFDYRQDFRIKPNGAITEHNSKITRYSPRVFAKKFARFKASDYVVVTSSETRPVNTAYTYEGTAIGESQSGNEFNIRSLNVDRARMQELTVKALDHGQAVWFAADIGRDVDHNTGIMHPEIFDRTSAYDFSKKENRLELDREIQLIFGLSRASHAMLLVGYDKPDPSKPPVKFKVENSWGDAVGTRGIYHLYQPWFEKYVYQVVIPKRFLSKTETEAWEAEAQVMGGGTPY